MRILSVIIVLLLQLTTARGQSVGLVLSGGGAKGLYHIGVIRALEENAIPIDYVSGTSMGAIIGALYASGRTVEEIGAILKSPDVNNWITGRIDPRYSYYFKQMHPSAAMITLRIDPLKKGGITAHLPSSIVPSDQLDMAFLDFFGGVDVATGGDFDRLIVPFRCVATDTKNQREKVFRSGKLGMAVRSSMSIPLLFEPMRADSTMYFDGGLYDNFPWKPLMDDFAPDVLIGSACTGQALDCATLMEQALTLAMLNTDYSLPREGDVLVTHSFPEISMLDFSKAELLIAEGYNDAMSNMERIKERIGRRADSAELERRRADFHARVPELRFDDVRITGLGRKQDDYVRRLLGLGRKSYPVSFEEFRSEYFKILADGDISGGFPSAEYDKATGRFALDMTMGTKPSLKAMIGGNLSSTALNQIYFGLEYKKIGSMARAHYFDASISAFHQSLSQNNRFDFFIHTPFYAEIGAHLNYYNYFRSNYGFMQRGREVTYYKRLDHYASVAVGMPTSRYSVVNLRVNAGEDVYLYNQTPVAVDDNSQMDLTKLRFAGIKLEHERYNMNHRLYPTSGVWQQISAIYVRGLENFRSGDRQTRHTNVGRQWFGGKFVREQYFHKLGRWFSAGYLVEAAVIDRDGFMNEYATNISAPAFQPTQHSKIVYMKEFRSDAYAAAGVMPIFHFSNSFYLKAGGYVFTPKHWGHEDIYVRQRARYILDASLVYQTILGPLSLSLSHYDTASHNWFLTFNFGTALFNRKGIFY